MKRDVFLNYSAVITGLGSFENTWESILNNRSGIVIKEHFKNSLLKRTGLSLYKREFSDKCNNFTRFLTEECISGFPVLPEDTFIIWTGIKNDSETVESIFNSAPAPDYTCAYDLRTWLAARLGLRKSGMEVNAACASSTVGTGLAVQFIADGIYDHVLVAAADYVDRFVYYGFAALKAMTEEPCMPFDVNRKGLTLGDGAVMLFLSAERKSDIRVSGYGLTDDANHITGPSRDGAGLAKALKKAVETAGLSPSDINAFCAHGTGTSYNDEMELKAARAVFGEILPPVFGIKGAIGHTLGAAGGIEIALCGRCLADGTIPPTVGCKAPESASIVIERTALPGNNIITSNSGFGGVNAAVLLENIS